MIEFSIDGKVTLVNRPERGNIRQKDRSSISFEPGNYIIANGKPYSAKHMMRLDLKSELKSRISRMPVGIEKIETGADVRFSPHVEVTLEGWKPFYGEGLIEYETLPSVENREWIGDRAVLGHKAVTGIGTMNLTPSFTCVMYMVGGFTFSYGDAAITISTERVSFSSKNTTHTVTPLPSRDMRFLHVIVKSNGRLIFSVDGVTDTILFDLEESGIGIKGSVLAMDVWNRDTYDVHSDQMMAGLRSGA